MLTDQPDIASRLRQRRRRQRLKEAGRTYARLHVPWGFADTARGIIARYRSLAGPPNRLPLVAHILKGKHQLGLDPNGDITLVNTVAYAPRTLPPHPKTATVRLRDYVTPEEKSFVNSIINAYLQAPISAAVLKRHCSGLNIKRATTVDSPGITIFML